MTKPTLCALLLLALSAGTALADGSDTQQMQKDYMAPMAGMGDAMHKGVMSKDPDVAFAQGMLPHHQGAVDMAKVELKYGKDPQMRKLAEDIIAAQETEMKQMKAWLQAHPQ
ncbi:DUF305 domain-containing protein [Pseudomonas sp. dw_358]|uniref:CopM family metallochaperone n=1 Tax=Pseudomonas sp. dw_358 TaxID=2720083 RepID=UPI001BD2125F|nr:DUF305 domain-containing protein [Pseudomonas sp. dw_358]